MEKIVLALGYFDSVHIGHRVLIDTAKQDAEKYNAASAVFTFSLNPDGILFGNNKSVYTLEERTAILKEIGIEKIISVLPTNEFLNQSGEKFLSDLVSDYDIKEVVFGSDYTCGKGAKFNAEKIEAFFNDRNIEVKILDLVKLFGQKVSTSIIAEKIVSGDIAQANELLGDFYRVSGIVTHGRARGRTLGFRTANIIGENEKYPLKTGVYATYVEVDGIKYKAVTNVGSRPTFNEFDCNFESYLIGFNGDLYNQKITLFFVKKLRDIKMFSTKEELSIEIKKNIQEADNLL